MERTMPMLRRSAEALLHWRDHLEKARQKRNILNFKVDKVFCPLDGEGIRSFKSSWRTARRLANIQDFHLHDLRHTFCSNILLAGGSLKDIKDMIGHRDIKMTDRYTHLDNKRKKQVQVMLEEHYQHKAN